MELVSGRKVGQFHRGRHAQLFCPLFGNFFPPCLKSNTYRPKNFPLFEGGKFPSSKNVHSSKRGKIPAFSPLVLNQGVSPQKACAFPKKGKIKVLAALLLHQNHLSDRTPQGSSLIMAFAPPFLAVRAAAAPRTNGPRACLPL